MRHKHAVSKAMADAALLIARQFIFIAQSAFGGLGTYRLLLMRSRHRSLRHKLIQSKREISERLWEKILFIALYFTAWGIGFAFSLGNGTPLYLDLMTLVATIFFMGIVLIPRERDMRLCTLGNSLIYFTYDIINLNIAAIAKLFSIISVIVALIRYRKKKNQNTKNGK